MKCIFSCVLQSVVTTCASFLNTNFSTGLPSIDFRVLTDFIGISTFTVSSAITTDGILCSDGLPSNYLFIQNQTYPVIAKHSHWTYSRKTVTKVKIIGGWCKLMLIYNFRLHQRWSWYRNSTVYYLADDLIPAYEEPAFPWVNYIKGGKRGVSFTRKKIS